MQIQLNSDHNITGSAGLQEKVEQVLEQELKHMASEITRIEVHLNDVNSAKGGEDDKRCLLEARVAGMKPIATEHRAATIDLALNGAAEQLSRALKNSLDKLESKRKGNETIRNGEQPDAELP